eukprot:gb/GECH01008872.1/.p1 GENE.gb/GECH01008872.1/~~gb/GECH01008872.1/.p1  ORF type:complete len:244 (+),score=35.78 gb/GECH01008872.1/:1-732(+)
MVFGFNSPNVDHDWDQHQSSASSSSFSSFWNYSSNMESSTDSDADPSSRPKRTRPPIPDKCVARIFLFLTPADVLNSLSRVCPRWFLIATDNFVWKRFFIRDWTHPLAQDVAASVSVETGLDNPFSAPHNRRWLNRYRERTWLVHQIHAGALQRAQTVDGMMSGMRWEWAPYLATINYLLSCIYWVSSSLAAPFTAPSYVPRRIANNALVAPMEPVPDGMALSMPAWSISSVPPTAMFGYVLY